MTLKTKSHIELLSKLQGDANVINELGNRLEALPQWEVISLSDPPGDVPVHVALQIEGGTYVTAVAMQTDVGWLTVPDATPILPTYWAAPPGAPEAPVFNTSDFFTMGETTE